MRPATEWLQPGLQHETWGPQDGQVQASLPPCPTTFILKQTSYLMASSICVRVGGKRLQSCPHLAKSLNEPACPLRSYERWGRSIRGSFAAMFPHLCTFLHTSTPHKSYAITKVASVKLAQQRVTQGSSCRPHRGVKGMEAGALESTLTHTELPNAAAISHLSG